ncbi:MAG: SDR family oxidoreductase [Dehalococcoidales bacterium]|nr:SDR family oxidoreductase [Dehalococcoidales bacterium]
MMSLDGKVAFVTGAASKRGMGHAIALRLAGEGACVVVTDKIADPPSLFPGDEGWGGLDAEVAEIKALGKDGLALTMDICRSQDVDAAVDKTIKKFGKVDILVHCAAIRGPVGTPIIDISDNDWKDIIDVNLNGTFFVARAVAREMVTRNKGGKIVLIASMAGLSGVPGSGAYSASKHGVIGLTKSLAMELAKYKINVNAINPGAIITNLRDSAFSKMAENQGISIDEVRKNDYQKAGTFIPLGRLGTPEEIADLAYFLVSDMSTYITGEYFNISGGIK